MHSGLWILGWLSGVFGVLTLDYVFVYVPSLLLLPPPPATWIS